MAHTRNSPLQCCAVPKKHKKIVRNLEALGNGRFQKMFLLFGTVQLLSGFVCKKVGVSVEHFYRKAAKNAVLHQKKLSQILHDFTY